MNFIRKVRSLFRHERIDTEMTEEMRHHVELQTELNLKAGMNSDEARYAALRQFGNVAALQEQAREVRGWLWLDQLKQDARFGLRQLRHNPGFTSIAILSLALGIGANTAIFSMVDAVLLKTLPVHKPDELVLFRWVDPPQGWVGSVAGSWEKDPVTHATTCTSFSRTAFDRFQENNQTLAALFAFTPFRSPTVVIDGQAAIVGGGQFVSGGYYPGLGVSAVMGRLITPGDDRIGAAPVAVISHRYWQYQFGGDQAVLGKTIQVNGTAVTIIGVTPREFHGTLDVGETPEITLPLSLWQTVDPFAKVVVQGNGPVWWLRVMGRLNPDTTGEQVRASFTGLFQQLALADLATVPRRGGDGSAEKAAAVPQLQITSGSQGLTEERTGYTQRLVILMILVGLVLLIACLNVANLLLARGVARQREIAARLALGATRRRLIGQLLTESGMIAFFGTGLGVILAVWTIRLLPAVNLLGIPASAALELNPGIDARVLGFTAVIALATGLLFGLVPAFRATRLDLRGGFHSGAQPRGRQSRSRLARTLMVMQVALSLVLLTGAGLFIRTLHNLGRVDVGFNHEHLLLFRIEATPAGYDDARASELYEGIVQQINALPGVRRASFSAVPLLSRSGWNTLMDISGRPSNEADPAVAMANAVDPGFFATLGVSRILGREFTAGDRGKVARVAIVNEALVKKYFDGQNPLGHRFRQNSRNGKVETEIVGVVHDVKYNDMRGEAPPTLYLPFRQHDAVGEANYVVRTAGDPEALTDSVRRIVHKIDPGLPLADIRTLDAQIESLFSTERLLARISGFFGLLALVLVGVGLYGLLSYSVIRRTREIGIRMALGAQPGGVLCRVIGESLILVGIGLVIGLGAAVVLTRLVGNLLYGIQPADPATLAVVTLVFVIAAILAAWRPGRRAAQVDPIVALRSE